MFEDILHCPSVIIIVLYLVSYCGWGGGGGGHSSFPLSQAYIIVSFKDFIDIYKRNPFVVLAQSHIYIDREVCVLKVSKCLAGGYSQKKLGRGVRPASQNPYPIYDQNLRFSIPYL